MRVINVKEIQETVYKLALDGCRRLTPSCLNALKTAKDAETSPLGGFALDCLVKNASIAEKNNMPVCQDTGLAVVMLEIGQEVFLEGEYLETAVNEGVRRAYRDGFFRKSAADPLTRENTKDNTPAMLYTEIVKGDKVKISFLPKGFGSENMSKIYMLTPAEGTEGVINAIVETVRVAGSKPCPPVFVGVGIGGTFDKCAFLAKKALMRPIGSSNARADVAAIEKAALERINALDIGAQGFKGKTTALGVNAEIMTTHIAGLPVAVNIQCNCARFESKEI